ncbi:MAG: DUF1573 domain-containing protein [Opitutales bacterium]|nr:DUF1573 domain-containing protein [Opitutales bacterium]MBT5167565.1 DUF1573 domain-containing protein [Opitutales bacterium]MBT5813002.1 DUF1573 domain-containing protein [Opitutales bacterium]MBT6380742.1 DUF1573 domain-containing protein [Opitutales bacterium]MBT6767863.1 DUF1573 domain-containing protein [Opitutales bacterium]
MKSVLHTALAGLALILFSTTATAANALSWEQTIINEDAEIGQAEVNAYYAFTNTSNSTITITKTQASCGCTVPSLEKETYAPGEAGKLLATFSIENRVGKQHKEITVETQEGGKKRSYKLTLNVDIPQLIQLKRRALLWKIGEDAEPKDCEIEIHSKYPMKIAGVLSKVAGDAESNFIFEIEEVKPNHQYVLRIIPKDTSKKTRETCYLTSPDDTSNHLKTFPIYAWIR